MKHKLSAADRVYQALLRQIVSGKRAGGQNLREEALCAELKTSRTPLREALHRLTQEGLVERKPRCGCTVKKFDVQEVRDLFQCRAMLESLALSLGIQAMTRDVLAPVLKQLEAATHDPESDAARAASLDADDLLHQIIVDHCPNKTLAALVRDLQLRTSGFRKDRTYSSADASSITRERQQLVQTILSQKTEKARQLLEKHIEYRG